MMTLIQIPFSKKMEIAVIEGRKCCTTRSKRYGSPGDEFKLSDGLYRIVDVQIMTLKKVMWDLHKLEGTNTMSDFEVLWRSLHRGHFSADKEYYVHFFQAINGGLR